jgi:hypothetical protein
VVLPAYARAERQLGRDFAYFRSPGRCLRSFRSSPQPEDIRLCEENAREVAERIAPFGISATEAMRLHASGKQVCHTIYVVGAQVIGAEAGRLPIQNGTARIPAGGLHG